MFAPNIYVYYRRIKRSAPRKVFFFKEKNYFQALAPLALGIQQDFFFLALAAWENYYKLFRCLRNFFLSKWVCIFWLAPQLTICKGKSTKPELKFQ